MSEPAVELKEEDVRAAVTRLGEIVPGVDGAEMADQVVAMLRGELTLKDVQGLEDEQMDAVYALAYNSFQSGQLEEASKLFTFLAKFDQFNKDYWMGLGASRFGLTAYQDALEAYSIAVLLDADDPLPPLRAADCHLALDETQEALNALEVVVERAEGKPDQAVVLERARNLVKILTTGEATATDG